MGWEFHCHGNPEIEERCQIGLIYLFGMSENNLSSIHNHKIMLKHREKKFIKFKIVT